jgi:hypothetical protein
LAPAVAPVDALRREKKDGGDRQLSESVCDAAVGVASKQTEVGEPGVRRFNWSAQSEWDRCLFHPLPRVRLISALRADEVDDPRRSDLATDDGEVIPTIDMERLDLTAEATTLMASRTAGTITQSWRSAPSLVQPMGMPQVSVAIEHFQPNFPRSTGLFPVPSPPRGALCCEPLIVRIARRAA